METVAVSFADGWTSNSISKGKSDKLIEHTLPDPMPFSIKFLVAGSLRKKSPNDSKLLAGEAAGATDEIELIFFSNKVFVIILCLKQTASFYTLAIQIFTCTAVLQLISKIKETKNPFLPNSFLNLQQGTK